MKLRPILLALLLLPSLLVANYDRSGRNIRVYGIKDYSGAFLEGFVGSMVLFYSTVFFASTRSVRGVGISGTGGLVSGIAAFGGLAAIGDAIRRAFASADVVLEVSPTGLLCQDAGVVAWKDVKKIEGVSYTTIQFGRPFNSGYRINIDTTDDSVPVEIDGSTLSESLNTVLSFMRKYYKGNIDIKRETVHDTTPRPTNVNVNNGGGGGDDSLVKLVQLGVDLFGKKKAA